MLAVALPLSVVTARAQSAPLEGKSLLAQAVAAQASQQSRQQSTAPQSQPASPPQDRPEPRRRGSMVGYIDDAVIASNIRIRFDAAFGASAPDRAEFFYAKCGCYRGLAEADPPAYDPNAPGPGPGVVSGYDFQQVYLQGQYAVGDRFSAFVELPVRWLKPDQFVPGTGSFPNQSGLSDIRAGVKVALAAAPDQYYVTAQLRGEFPSGDAAKGLGTNHGTIVPALLYYQRVTDRFSFESQIGEWHPLSGSAGVPTAGSDSFSGDVVFYGIGPSYEVYRSNAVRFAPVVELVGWRVLGGFQTQIPGPAAGVAAPADGLNIVNLKVGARTTFRDATSLYVGYGRALTDTHWYDDILRIELRYQF
jgi:hypothetical protein